MEKYINVIGTMALIYGGIIGFFGWVNSMAISLDYGDTFIFVIKLIFVELLIPFYGFIPFVGSFVVLFVLCLPILFIYRLFKND